MKRSDFVRKERSKKSESDLPESSNSVRQSLKRRDKEPRQKGDLKRLRKLRKGSETLRECRSEFVESDFVLNHSDGLTWDIVIGALEGVTPSQKMIHACTIDWCSITLIKHKRIL